MSFDRDDRPYLPYPTAARDRSAIPVGDRVIMVLILVLVVASIPFLWMAITPEARVERYKILSQDPDGCQAEIWVKGQAGDTLSRLVNPRTRYRPATFYRAVIIHERLNSTRLPSEVRTPQGNCQVTRWNLEIGGAQTDSVER